MKANNITLYPEFVKLSREKFDEMGFKTVNAGDNHFFLKKYPERWRRTKNYLVDGNNNIRGVFDAINDSVHMLTCYKVMNKLSKDGKKVMIGFGDGSRFIKRIGTVKRVDQKNWIKLHQMAFDYGDMFYPNWQDPSAYWEKKKSIEKIKSLFRRKIKK